MTAGALITEAIVLTLFPAMMAFAAASDFFTMTIANRVSLILIGGFLMLALLTGMSGAEMLSHAGAAALVLVFAFTFFACNWIGGGDAKLATATALWLGFGHLLDYLVYASIGGGLLTLLLMQFRTMPLPSALAGANWAKRLHRLDGGIPYGIALAAAALAIYPHTEWMRAVGL
jgi:prepilin peptidase CpaA